MRSESFLYHAGSKTSYFKAALDETVDAARLLNAVKTALLYHPLFRCKMMYDKQYYLEDNDNPEIHGCFSLFSSLLL